MNKKIAWFIRLRLTFVNRLGLKYLKPNIPLLSLISFSKLYGTQEWTII